LDAAENLWIAPLRREQLLELLEGKGPQPVRAESSLALLAESNRELLGIWTAAERGALSPFPQLLVAEPPTLQDLFAWSASYLRAFGPLSAIARTLTPKQLKVIIRREECSQPWRVAAGAIGLIVGEIMSHNDKIGAEAAVAAAPSTTLAFALVRAWYLGLGPDAAPEIRNRYDVLFDQLQRPFTGSSTAAIEYVAMSLLGTPASEPAAIPASTQLRQWMEELRSGASIYEIARHALRTSDDLLGNEDAGNLEQMTAEDRVRFFDKVAPRIAGIRGSGDQLERGFALALAAFVCRPGIEQQASLLREHATALRESWLWLGALQTFSPVVDALSLGSGSGWRIARELFRPETPWAAPRADIGIDEVLALSGGKSKTVERLLGRSRLDVEIYPMISTTVRGFSAATDHYDDERRGGDHTSSQEAITIAKMEFVEHRLDELLREIRTFQPEGKGRPARKRR
jgi:hypothetical protein